MTFAAFLVVAASVVIAAVWSAKFSGDDRGEGEDDDE
jgi:hypothetical protein